MPAHVGDANLARHPVPGPADDQRHPLGRLHRPALGVVVVREFQVREREIGEHHPVRPARRRPLRRRPNPHLPVRTADEIDIVPGLTAHLLPPARVVAPRREGVVARTAVEHVASRATQQLVVAGASGQPVVSVTTIQCVVARAASERVVVRATEEHVGTRSTLERIVAGQSGHQHIVRPGVAEPVRTCTANRRVVTTGCQVQRERLVGGSNEHVVGFSSFGPPEFDPVLGLPESPRCNAKRNIQQLVGCLCVASAGGIGASAKNLRALRSRLALSGRHQRYRLDARLVQAL